MTITVEKAPTIPKNPRELVSSELFARLVRRTAKEHDLSEEIARRSVTQAVMMLGAIGDNPGVTFYPSVAVDYGWHTFILDTQHYHEFCERVAGKYIHHNPIEGATDGGVLMRRTANFLRENGYPVDDDLWSAVESVHCSGGESCDNTIRCNN
jgi:hypothetical protein